MVHYRVRTLAIAVCLAAVAWPDDLAAQDPAKDAKMIEGLWSGSWGGGQRDGVVFQPVLAEMVVKGDRVELHGFRNAGSFAGTMRLDPAARRMVITPDAAGGRPAPKAVEYAYDVQGDRLTLTDADKVPVSLQRHRVVEKPLAHARVELVAATGINDAGDLLVTEVAALRAGQAGATYYQPEARSLKTRQAAVFLVQDGGVKRITLDEARRLIRDTTPVAVSYRPDNLPANPTFQSHELWKNVGAAPPDSEAVLQTVARTLRPGTLVFVLSAKENVAVP